MQTFSSMQRNSTNQATSLIVLYIIIYVIYESVSSIYIFLPPLFAVLFILFKKAIDEQNLLNLAVISFCLVIYEANFGLMLFSSIVYFSLIYKFLVPKIEQNINCKWCINLIYIFIAYFGFYLFMLLISNIFLLPLPTIYYYIIFYIVIEFLIVSLL